MRLTIYRAIRGCGASLVLLGAVVVGASCGGGGDGGTEPPVVGSIAIAPVAPVPIAAGGTLQLSAVVHSTTGAVISAQNVAFTSSAPNIATVAGSGQVKSVGPVGEAVITAAIGAVNASVTVRVVAGPPASLTRTSADPGTVAPGATVGDSVRFVVKDAFANPISQAAVAFTVSAGGGQVSPASAQTDVLGRAATMFITGDAAGTNTLNATVTSITPVTLSLVTTVGSVSIASISPSPMTPGAAVTITGAGFDANATGNAVTIDGQAVAVTSASATQLVIAVPMTLQCTPTHQARVQVTAGGAAAVARQTLRVGSARSLAVGSSVVLTDPADVYCTELSAASGRYIVNVLSTSTVATGLSPFHFVGATSIPAGTTTAPAAFTLRQSIQAPVLNRQAAAGGMLPSVRSEAHALELESNRLVYRRLKRSFRRTPAVLASPDMGVRTSLAAAPVVVGDTRTFRVVQPSTAVGATGSCSNYIEVTARAVYVGTKAIVYEDTKAPLVGTMDSYFTQLGQEFDTSMYPSDAAYFGDPLITDLYTDNDQHLNMVFTASIPSGLAGFVTGCDFFARSATDDPASNFGENFYARVPKISGSGFNSDTPDSWLRIMRPTVVHEVKHIAAVGAHLVNDAAAFEESWLEEGMAMVAEEVWARDRIYSGATWKGNLLYASTLYCDVRPSNLACNKPPFVMFGIFEPLYHILDVPGTGSLFGRVADGDFSFYFAAWSFIRYNADRYATSEADFLRGITQATDVSGLANIARQTGADANQMMGNWSLALYLDENNAMAGNLDAKFPSWDMRDIYGGMNHDFPAELPKTYPFAAQPVTAGDFKIDNAGIHGGAFIPYELAAVAGTTRTIGVSGSPLLRLAIARIQ
ncbi:MAG: IPT/TIG domain-containing protein [Gemmatimonadaceae bacterium]